MPTRTVAALPSRTHSCSVLYFRSSGKVIVASLGSFYRWHSRASTRAGSRGARVVVLRQLPHGRDRHVGLLRDRDGTAQLLHLNDETNTERSGLLKRMAVSDDIDDDG